MNKITNIPTCFYHQVVFLSGEGGYLSKVGNMLGIKKIVYIRLMYVLCVLWSYLVL